MASNTITLNLTTYTKYLFLYWPHLYQYKNGLDLWVKSASQMISLVLNSLLPCNNKLYQLTITLLSEITNKMTPTICVSVSLQAQYRITRSILIFARIGRVHLRLIQDSGISLDFKWHVMTKIELSSANLALTIKHMKIHKSVIAQNDGCACPLKKKIIWSQNPDWHGNIFLSVIFIYQFPNLLV